MLKWLRGGDASGRMAVIDAVRVDGRRTVMLVRRDNVEHLVMIGGPNDLVIEPNIMRDAARKPVRPPTPGFQEPPRVNAPRRAPPPEPPPKTVQNLAELTRRLEAELLRSPPLRGRPPPLPPARPSAQLDAPNLDFEPRSNPRFDAKSDSEIKPEIEAKFEPPKSEPESKLELEPKPEPNPEQTTEMQQPESQPTGEAAVPDGKKITDIPSGE